MICPHCKKEVYTKKELKEIDKMIEEAKKLGKKSEECTRELKRLFFFRLITTYYETIICERKWDLQH